MIFNTVSLLLLLRRCGAVAGALIAATTANADCSSHPLLLTETCLAPSGIRTQLAQLVFEAYGLPALNFVPSAPAAFFYHHHAAANSQIQQQQPAQMLWQQQQQQLAAGGGGGGGQGGAAEGVSVGAGGIGGLCGSSSALVVCSGHSATYVVPVYKVRACVRVCVGCAHKQVRL